MMIYDVYLCSWSGNRRELLATVEARDEAEARAVAGSARASLDGVQVDEAVLGRLGLDATDYLQAVSR
jgi:hypothetical protein